MCYPKQFPPWSFLRRRQSQYRFPLNTNRFAAYHRFHYYPCIFCSCRVYTLCVHSSRSSVRGTLRYGLCQKSYLCISFIVIFVTDCSTSHVACLVSFSIGTTVSSGRSNVGPLPSSSPYFPQIMSQTQRNFIFPIVILLRKLPFSVRLNVLGLRPLLSRYRIPQRLPMIHQFPVLILLTSEVQTLRYLLLKDPLRTQSSLGVQQLVLLRVVAPIPPLSVRVQPVPVVPLLYHVPENVPYETRLLFILPRQRVLPVLHVFRLPLSLGLHTYEFRTIGLVILTPLKLKTP